MFQPKKCQFRIRNSQCAETEPLKLSFSFNDLYHFCNPAPVNSSCLYLALIDGTRSGPPSPRQVLRFLPFRDQWPALGVLSVPWLI